MIEKQEKRANERAAAFVAVEHQLSRKVDMSGVIFLESLHVLLPTCNMFANLFADFSNPDLFVGT